MAKQSNKTEIAIGERFKVVKYDTLNWTIYELREIEQKGNTARGGTIDWVKLPNYFAQLDKAIMFIANQLTDNHQKQTLEEAVKAIQSSNAQLAKDVRKALSAVQS